MKNFKKQGDKLTWVADAITLSGAIVIVGGIVGIATKDAAIGDSIELSLEGVYELTKHAPLVISQGNKLYWDSTPGEVTKTVTDVFIGFAHSDAASNDTTVNVLLPEGGNPVTQAANVAALTDNSGGAAADGTIAVVTVAAAIVDNSGGAAADGTIGVITAGTPADLAAQAAINTQIRDAIKELSTMLNSNRTAIIALKDGLTEVASKVNAEISALKTAGLQASA